MLIKGKDSSRVENINNGTIDNSEFESVDQIFIFEDCDPSEFIGTLPSDFSNIGAQYSLTADEVHGTCGLNAYIVTANEVRNGIYSYEKYREIKDIIFSEQIKTYNYATDMNGKVIANKEKYFVMMVVKYQYVGITAPSDIDRIMEIIHDMADSAS